MSKKWIRNLCETLTFFGFIYKNILKGNFVKKIKFIKTLLLSIAVLLFTLSYSISASTSPYQNTDAYANPGGAISLSQYNQTQLNQLSNLAAGSGDNYKGNTSLLDAATQHIYGMEVNGKIAVYKNVVGLDGVFQLYNASEFMSDAQVQSAAYYWNKLAQRKIVEIVNDPAKSDQTIWDSYDSSNNALGGETYIDGIAFYPANWKPEYYTPTQLDQQKVATLIHEIGHGLGVTHLGGGIDGANASNDVHYVSEFMSLWTPFINTTGIVSTQEDAATLALAGLTYQTPQKQASWVLDNSNYKVIYNLDKTISSGFESSF